MKRYQALAIAAIAFLGCSYVDTSSASVSATTAAVSTTIMIASEVKPQNSLQEKIDIASANAKLVSLDCSTQAQWAMSLNEIGNATLEGFKNSCESGLQAAADRTIGRQAFSDSLDKVIKYSGATNVKDVDALIAYATISMMAFDDYRASVRK